jgi:hypothetical protein
MNQNNHTGVADKFLAWPGRKQARKHVRDVRHFNNIETRAVIKIFFSLQGKAPNEILAILTETLACFHPGRYKDLSAPLTYVWVIHATYTSAMKTNFNPCLYKIISRHLMDPAFMFQVITFSWTNTYWKRCAKWTLLFRSRSKKKTFIAFLTQAKISTTCVRLALHTPKNAYKY